jgi:hypothetical protein
VKKKYGTNSLRIEYEGDGEFLKRSPLVKRADVYQNYAELELVDIHKSRELLSELDELDLRKFEIIEPSLNSIFLHVVGPSPTAEDSPATRPPMVRPTRAPMDGRVRKELISLVLTSVIGVFLLVFMTGKMDVSWPIVGVLLAAVGISVFRFTRAKRQVETERRRLEGGQRG